MGKRSQELRAHSAKAWFEERLGWQDFRASYLRKVFPLHPSYFLGEIALFCFVILVLTGLLLAISYEPSARLVDLDGNKVPAAYASVFLNDHTPLGFLLRQVHHWAAHLMIAAVILHLLRIFFTGLYKNPREVNWLVGLLLLFLTVLAAFSGYLLPYDAFSLTATGVSYHIVRSAPWIGSELADFLFSGKFPSLGLLPRFYAYHAILIPFLMVGLIVLHLLVMLKQKHSQPNSSRRFVADHKIMGVPFWPQQALVMFVLFLILNGVLFFVAGTFPAHPVAYYGPPELVTPVVKPDWYLLWWYGALRLIPSGVDFEFWGATINPENIGGILFPFLVMTLLLLVPFFDRQPTPIHIMERCSAHRVRTSIGVGAIALLFILTLAAYNEELGLSIELLQLAFLVIPALISACTYGALRLHDPKVKEE